MTPEHHPWHLGKPHSDGWYWTYSSGALLPRHYSNGFWSILVDDDLFVRASGSEVAYLEYEIEVPEIPLTISPQKERP